MDRQLPAVLQANLEYRRGGGHVGGLAPQPARQLVILTCMDARLDLFPALGLEVGDAHILRNAGGRASDDAIRSLVVSAHLLGTREVGVIHHTGCGMQGRTDADIADLTGVRDLPFLTFDDLEGSVRDDVERIRRSGYFPDGFIAWGAVFDVETGEVRMVEEPTPS